MTVVDAVLMRCLKLYIRDNRQDLDNVFTQFQRIFVPHPPHMETELDDNAAELAAEMEVFVSGLMMQPKREQVASEIGGE